MTSLLHLAPELKGSVCASLTARDLAALCRTCRSLRALALPLLYRKIVITWDEEDVTRDPTLLTVAALVRALTDRPECAALVKSVNLVSTAAPEVVEHFLQHTRQLCHLQYHCMLPSSQTALSLDALRSGLDHVSKTLTHLTFHYEIEVDMAVDVTTIRDLLYGSLGSLRSMEALTHLDISLLVLFGQIDPDDAPPLAELLPPRLRRLTINDELWGYDAFRDWEGESVFAALDSLFGRGAACKAATPDLQEFVLDFRDSGWYGEGYQPERLDQIQSMCEAQGIDCLILTSESGE